MAEDYYKILSVEPTASSKEIQQAADRLISNWGEKRGQSSQKRSEILTQIRRASAVLTDPLQRFEYDIKHGFKRDFSEQSTMKKSPFIPLKYSESIETIDTVKIPGGLDYEKLERSIAAMETPDLTELNDLPDMKPPSISASAKNASTEKVIDEISKNRRGSETDADNIRETDRFKVNSSNLKQDFFGDDLKTFVKEFATLLDEDVNIKSGRSKVKSSNLKQYLTTEDLKISAKESAKLLDADNITEIGRYKENSSNLKQDLRTEDLKTSAKESATPLDADNITESGSYKENSSNLKQDSTTEDLKTSAKESATPLDAANITESGRYKENSSNLKQNLTIEDLRTSAKESVTLLDADNITESGRYKENSSNLKQDLTTEDLKTSAKESATLLDADITENGQYTENSSKLKQYLTTEDLKTSAKEFSTPHDADIITESGRYKENSSNLKQDLTTENLKTHGKESVTLLDTDINTESGTFKRNASYSKQDSPTDDLKKSGKESAMQINVDKVKEKKKTIKGDWKDSISETDIISEPIESVTVTKRIAGTDVKTVYSFGPDAEFIEVFVNGRLRVKIVNDESQDMYCNERRHDELPPGVIVGASTAIAANSCIITTEVTRRGNREAIAVYKNDVLLCRTGSTILEDIKQK